MKKKHVHLAQDLRAARRAISAAKAAGVAEDEVSLVARPDIEMEAIPEDYRNAATDFKPAMLKGVLGGGSAGLLAGLIAMAIPGLGVTLAGAAALAAVGAATGTWSSSLIGATLPDPVRRRFEDEIAQGRILVLIDAADEDLPRIDAALAESGVVRLPFEEPTSLS